MANLHAFPGLVQPQSLPSPATRKPLSWDASTNCWRSAPAPVAAPKPRVVKPVRGTCHLTLGIGTTAYAVKPLSADVGSGVSRLYQLRKADGTVYFASEHAYGCECTCPSWVFDHDGLAHAPDCKHLAALRAVGLLPKGGA